MQINKNIYKQLYYYHNHGNQWAKCSHLPTSFQTFDSLVSSLISPFISDSMSVAHEYSCFIKKFSYQTIKLTTLFSDLELFSHILLYTCCLFQLWQLININKDKEVHCFNIFNCAKSFTGQSLARLALHSAEYADSFHVTGPLHYLVN